MSQIDPLQLHLWNFPSRLRSGGLKYKLILEPGGFTRIQSGYQNHNFCCMLACWNITMRVVCE